MRRCHYSSAWICPVHQLSCHCPTNVSSRSEKLSIALAAMRLITSPAPTPMSINTVSALPRMSQTALQLRNSSGAGHSSPRPTQANRTVPRKGVLSLKPTEGPLPQLCGSSVLLERRPWVLETCIQYTGQHKTGLGRRTG